MPETQTQIADAGPVLGARGLAQAACRPLVTPLVRRIVAGAEALNAQHALNGNPPVHGTAAFPWVRGLEAATPAIRAELAQVLMGPARRPRFRQVAPHVRRIARVTDRRTFCLYAYGLRSARNIAECPDTWQAVKAIPGLQTAAFSILEPRQPMPVRRAPYNGVLRLHLGLIVPEAPVATLGLRVDAQLCRWEAGKALIFDGCYDHAAWNRTDSARVVLCLDFMKPTRQPAQLLNRALLNLALFQPYVRGRAQGAERQEPLPARPPSSTV